jgi:hypothetical protein
MVTTWLYFFGQVMKKSAPLFLLQSLQALSCWLKMTVHESFTVMSRWFPSWSGAA